jgi:hypothetical protein
VNDPISELEQALADERAAITALDSAALERAQERKLACAEQIRNSGADARGLRKIRAAARTNLLLLQAAIDTLGATLGLTSEPTTYDARARMSVSPRAWTRRDL